MIRQAGRSVRLFLVDGSPSGVVTAEIVNWTGQALLAPRSELSSVRRRDEMKRTGIYFLLGEVATTSEKRSVYIGESDEVGRRIEQHAASRNDDFFERFCVITSKDANLTKAHARYLESRLTSVARGSGRAQVLNSNDPPLGSLPESDIADMEFFISQIELVLPVLGFDFLKPIAFEIRTSKNTVEINSPTVKKSGDSIELTLHDRKSGITAAAIFDGVEYVVTRGSQARATPQKSLEEHLSAYFALREALIAEESLLESPNQPGVLQFTRDVVFKSPSAASAVILGRSDNGRRTWKVKTTGEELAEYQARQLREAAE